jgi:hypothetical protein
MEAALYPLSSGNFMSGRLLPLTSTSSDQHYFTIQAKDHQQCAGN